jgi:hypothetical protein
MARAFELGRYELKYVVPVSSRDRLVGLARETVVPDPHAHDVAVELGDALKSAPVAGARGYVVHSLYLDTPGLDDYSERLNDARVRRRMRIRTYGAPGQRQPIFFEAKRKWEDRVIKVRAMVGHADDFCATEGEQPWQVLAVALKGPHADAARRFASIAQELSMRPVSCVHYVREVYVDPAPGGEKTRITLDYAVTATVRPGPRGLYAPPDIVLIPMQFAVLELKFDGAMPGWMRSVVARASLRAESVSKFGLSVAMGLRVDHPAEIRRLTPITVVRGAA